MAEYRTNDTEWDGGHDNERLQIRAEWYGEQKIDSAKGKEEIFKHPVLFIPTQKKVILPPAIAIREDYKIKTKTLFYVRDTAELVEDASPNDTLTPE